MKFSLSSWFQVGLENVLFLDKNSMLVSDDDILNDLSLSSGPHYNSFIPIRESSSQNIDLHLSLSFWVILDQFGKVLLDIVLLYILLRIWQFEFSFLVALWLIDLFRSHIDKCFLFFVLDYIEVVVSLP
jgi:hypothetical protein